jgi:putative GTP pyrophosphokinase
MTPEEWGDLYAPLRPRYEQYALKLEALVSELCAYANITTEAVEGRAKAMQSFIEKVRDKGQQYQDPIREMPDLVGLRIVTYVVDDARAAREVIEGNFDIDWSRSSVGTTDGDPDRFGYVSDHYEVRLKASRAGLPEWAPYTDVWVEIQVRTVLQHAWAAISHKLQYKAAREVPRELRRQLSRMSALLEVADKEFSELSLATAQLDERYLAAVDAGDLNVELNADSLAAFLNVTRRHIAYQHVAEELGYNAFELEGDDAASLDYSNMKTLAELAVVGADLTGRWMLKDFDEIVPDPVPDYLKTGLSEILDNSLRNGFHPTAVPVDMLILGYVIALRGGLDPDDTAAMTAFVDELREAIKEALYNVEEIS